MTYFFEVIANKIGYSRIGRILFSKERKLYISTPNLIIPIKNALMKQWNFIQEFEEHEIFTISKEFFLKIGFLREKFRNNGFIFTYPGTMQKFQEILKKNTTIFTEDNIISIIPFNIPTTSINREFALKEIRYYLQNVQKILNNYPNLNFGLSIRTFDFAELFDLFISIINQFENIDILINNAGIGLYGETERTSFKDLQKIMDVNFFGSFFCMSEVIPFMKKEWSKSVVSWILYLFSWTGPLK